MKKANRSKAIPFRLPKDINDDILLIHRTPEVVLDAVYFQKRSIEKPFVTALRSPSLQLNGVRRTELIAPIPDGFVGEENAAKGHHQLHLAQAHGKVEIEPNALRNDLLGKTGDRDRE